MSSAHSFVEMAKITFAFFAAFLAGLASAKSFHGMTVHPDTVMLGSDPDSDWTVAYDRNFAELERYHTPFNNRTAAAPAALSGKCRALTANELKSRMFPSRLLPSHMFPTD